MTVLKIFEKVNLVTPVEQRRFFNYFEDGVNELMLWYGDKLVIEDGKIYAPPSALSDENVVRPLYRNALVDYILYRAGLGEAHFNMFIQKAKLAYLRYWNTDTKGKRIKRMRW